MDETERLLHVAYHPERHESWVIVGFIVSALVIAATLALVALQLSVAIDQLHALNACRRP